MGTISLTVPVPLKNKMAAHRMLLYPNLVRKPKVFQHKENDLNILNDNQLRQRYRSLWSSGQHAYNPRRVNSRVRSWPGHIQSCEYKECLLDETNCGSLYLSVHARASNKSNSVTTLCNDRTIDDTLFKWSQVVFLVHESQAIHTKLGLIVICKMLATEQLQNIQGVVTWSHDSVPSQMTNGSFNGHSTTCDAFLPAQVFAVFFWWSDPISNQSVVWLKGHHSAKRNVFKKFTKLLLTS
jgi:hypothetical protein